MGTATARANPETREARAGSTARASETLNNSTTGHSGNGSDLQPVGREFESFAAAARALLTHPEPKLTQRSGQFCGGLMFSTEPLTEKQARWLSDLLRKHGLPPLAGEADHG